MFLRGSINYNLSSHVHCLVSNLLFICSHVIVWTNVQLPVWRLSANSWIQSSQLQTNWGHRSLSWLHKLQWGRHGPKNRSSSNCFWAVCFFVNCDLEGRQHQRQTGLPSLPALLPRLAKHSLATMPDEGTNECTWKGQHLYTNAWARHKEHTDS